jgi:ketosteroid isomerase-like protein
MSQENVEAARAVRIPLSGYTTRRHRTLDERILVRFPALARLLLGGWARLQRRSRLRRVMLVRVIRLGYAAANRRDFDLLLTGLDPGIEYHSSEAWQIGFDPLYHGHDGYLQVWRGLFESFEDIRLDPEELLDLGDRFLVTITLSGHGAGSGVSTSQPLFQLFTFRRGLVVRQDDFVDRAKALEAAGLSEQDAHADS